MVQNKKIRPRIPSQTERLDSPLFQAVARDLLRSGTSVRFQARGLSMLPEIQDGDLLQVAPATPGSLRRGEIVLVEGEGKLRAHRLIAADVLLDRFVTQGDASQEPDAPARADQIVGRVISKEVLSQRVPEKEVRVKDQLMNGIEQQGGMQQATGEIRRVGLHGVRAQTRRRMAQARGFATGWVKAALGMRTRAGVTLCLLALCLAAMPAAAQVTVDSKGNGGGRVTTGGNVSFLHTTAAGTGRTLVVGVAMNIGSNATTQTAQVSTLTYNGSPLTFISAHNDAGNNRRVEMWFLLAPAVGANIPIVVTLNSFGAGTVGVTAGSVTFLGADQTDPVRPFVFSDGTDTTTTSLGALMLDVPSALQEQVYAVTATGGDYSQSLPAAGFGGLVQQWTGASNGAPTASPDVDGSGFTVTGAPSVPIPVLVTRNGGSASTSTVWASGAVSIHPLNADMGVTVTTNGAQVAGGQAVYTIKAQNDGWSDAASVVVTFTLAAGQTFVSSSATQGSCAGTTTVTCNLGTVASAANATVTIKATMANPGNYTTPATVSSSTTDLYTGNNSFTVTVPVQAVVCATPGNDGTPGAAITGIVNTYYPGAASATAGVAATSISVGTVRAGGGAAIANGDLLLVMQMQDATINTTNGAVYGDGSGGSGYTALNGAGAYEYVKATGAVAGGLVPIAGAGLNGGLIYSYTNAAATNTQGQRSFQVVRVPQYVAATLGAGLTASAWDGATGGVLAIDVQNTLTLASRTIDVTGLGFRGGAGLQLSGVTAGSANTDFVFAAPAAYAAPGAAVNGWHGSKGEGIAGTPAFVQSAGTFLATGSKYPSGAAADGSMGRGAPGNGGGGGTDAESVAGNSNNSGGSGGGNGGGGGAGGDSQAVDLASGGVPGGAFPNSINRVVMGGGGGAGGRNNSPGDLQASSGAAGGGIVMIRAGFLSGTATITANGAAAYAGTLNDGGGGGGAGGTVVVLSQAGGENGLTVNVKGGAGGNANAAAVFAVFTGGVHGPGGGGGGGMIISSGGLAASNRNGGAFGTTETSTFEWGATAGTIGATPINSAKLSQVAGVRSGVECAAPDCVITKTHAGNFIHGSINNNYTITVSNASPSLPTVGVVTVVDTVPTGETATALTGTGWTCVLGTLTCTRADALAPLASYPPITLTVSVSVAPPSNTLNQVATVSGGGEVQTNNDVATDPTTIVGTKLTISKAGAPDPIRPGQTLTYTINVANAGPNDGAASTVTDSLPVANVTYVNSSATLAGGATGGTCAFASPTVTCSYTAFPVGASSVITITVTTVGPAKVTNTATLTDTGVPAFIDMVSASTTTTTTFPTSVNLKSFTVERAGSGTVINWQTGGERHNLGFNVYREENGARVKVNPSLIAGSALRMRETLEQHHGTSYAWPDSKNGSAYWLEDVEINGAKTMHGPVSAAAIASSTAITQATTARAATLAEMSLASAQAASLGDASAVASGPTFDTSRALPHFAAAQAVTTQQRQTQFGLAAGAAVKLALRTEGWYRVSQKQLVAAGLNANVDPKFLRLYTEGVEQPIRVTGATNGPGGFGANAAIEFYATGIDTPFSDARVGWLVAGNTAGLRVLESGNAGGTDNALTSFPYAVELRQRTTYFAALLNGENNDNFFGAMVMSAPIDQVLTAHGVADAASGVAQLEVGLQGVTTGSNHNVSVSLNGTPLGAVTLTDQQLGKTLLEVPAGTIREGENTVTLTALNGDNDVSLVDHITLSYGHSYAAESDALRFTAPAGDHLQLTGFLAKPMRLVDITNAAHPINLQTKVSGTAGAYILDVNVPWTASGTHTLLALGWNELAHAAATKNQPSTWHAPQAGSNIVMISHPSFVSALQPLVKLRQSQGQTVSVVTVDDLYDEFNFGERSPQALRDFLASATGNWTTHPQYLLLVGDATLDPRNYLGFGNDDFVPTRIVDTFYLKTASDEWFSDFTNTGIGAIATGRLPVRTVADAQIAVRKITNYDAAGNTGTWSKQALLVADADAEGLGFATDTAAVKSLLPRSFVPTVVDGSVVSTGTAHAEILSAINSGQLVVNYLGHGSVEVWGNGSLLADADAATMTNGKRLPVFLIMDCLNGYFQDVATTSMAESLLLAPNGGAVAVWSSSGLNDAAPQALLDQQVVQGLFSSKNATLGDAIRAAKAKVTVPDVRKTYILFGDPAMKLHQ